VFSLDIPKKQRKKLKLLQLRDLQMTKKIITERNLSLVSFEDFEDFLELEFLAEVCSEPFELLARTEPVEAEGLTLDFLETFLVSLVEVSDADFLSLLDCLDVFPKIKKYFTNE
jgi:hypothetical protein